MKCKKLKRTINHYYGAIITNDGYENESKCLYELIKENYDIIFRPVFIINPTNEEIISYRDKGMFIISVMNNISEKDIRKYKKDGYLVDDIENIVTTYCLSIPQLEIMDYENNAETIFYTRGYIQPTENRIEEAKKLLNEIERRKESEMLMEEIKPIKHKRNRL